MSIPQKWRIYTLLKLYDLLQLIRRIFNKNLIIIKLQTNHFILSVRGGDQRYFRLFVQNGEFGCFKIRKNFTLQREMMGEKIKTQLC